MAEHHVGLEQNKLLISPSKLTHVNTHDGTVLYSQLGDYTAGCKFVAAIEVETDLQYNEHKRYAQ